MDAQDEQNPGIMSNLMMNRIIGISIEGSLFVLQFSFRDSRAFGATSAWFNWPRKRPTAHHGPRCDVACHQHVPAYLS
jgi:hypothetical protein